MEKQGTKKNNEHETEIKKNNNSLFFLKGSQYLNIFYSFYLRAEWTLLCLDYFCKS